MTDPDGLSLGQTLLVDPAVPFATIAAAVAESGLQPSLPATGMAPLIAGEPELASWSSGGAKPIVTYTLNPVAMLRVLDVATVPPEWRARIAGRLPLLSDAAVADLLDAADVRSVLRGLWAARETLRTDLLIPIERLAGTADGLVGRQATVVAANLARLAQTQHIALDALQQVADAAVAVIARLGDAEFCARLLPDQAACASLFDPAWTLAAAQAAAALRDGGSLRGGLPDRAQTVTGATAGLLRAPNPISLQFPIGYRRIAGWLTPDPVWLTWRAEGVQADGLVWAEGRWFLLPKPYRLLRQLVPTG